MSRVPKVPSLLRRISFSFLLGFGIFSLGVLVEGFLTRNGITRGATYVDDLLVGILAGLVVFAYEQRRSRDIRQKVAVIAAMNHHVRNALQTISYAHYSEQAKQIQVIQEGVNRIQWALQEILPGEGNEAQNFPPTAAVTELKAAEAEPPTSAKG
ncbi:MAG: hypothetical protein ACXV5J_10620 [Candidatus Angelobacter sp.]